MKKPAVRDGEGLHARGAGKGRHPHPIWVGGRGREVFFDDCVRASVVVVVVATWPTGGQGYVPFPRTGCAACVCVWLVVGGLFFVFMCYYFSGSF